jgi:nucleoside-diphosphate-sugar epimerase
VASVPEIISALQEAAPPGLQALDDSMLAELRALTQVLMTARPEAADELHRFCEIRGRGIGAGVARLGERLRGRTVLVTGGTGCIGSTLLAQIARLGPARLVSVSRGQTAGWPRQPGADYRYADIATLPGLDAIFAEVRPDVVFHLAAQRDPGLAEREARLTVSTNVLGTRNVVRACERHGVAELSCASSGKALRPYSREVYTAGKRAGEWILADAAARTEMRISASRFTHVVDNSIVYGRLVNWASSGVIRLHDWRTLFYAQSALESAQLLLAAGLTARPGRVRVHAVSDLGWPVSLLDLALGTLQEAGSDSPIYFSGHDPGYERVPFPGLYDPVNAGDVSPLLSAFESAYAEHDPELGVDACPVRVDLGKAPAELLTALERACAAGADGEICSALDELSWQLLDASLAALPQPLLERVARLTAPRQHELDPDHARMLSLICQHAASSAAAPGVPADTLAG